MAPAERRAEAGWEGFGLGDRPRPMASPEDDSLEPVGASAAGPQPEGGSEERWEGAALAALVVAALLNSNYSKPYCGHVPLVVRMAQTAHGMRVQVVQHSN